MVIHPVDNPATLKDNVIYLPDKVAASGAIRTNKKPKLLMPIGVGVSGYEACEAWYLALFFALYTLQHPSDRFIS